MWIDRDHVSHAVLAKGLVHAPGVRSDELVEPEVVGERSGVEVVFVQRAELDAGCAQKAHDPARNAVVVRALPLSTAAP